MAGRYGRDDDYHRDDDAARRRRIMEEMEDARRVRTRETYRHDLEDAGGRDTYGARFGHRDTGEEPRGGVRRHGGPSAPDHRGRGPKGYKRSDQRIEEDVNDRLTDDPRVDASEVQVHVQNGEVTLTGTVDSREARRRAEDVAEDVSGVTYVMNNLRVRQPGTSGATG